MSRASVNRMAIEGELTIFTARELQERLLALLALGEDLEVDLSGVGEMDSAGVQLLLATRTEAAARDVALRFTGPSSVVVDTLDLCDLTSHFADTVLISRPDKETP